MSVAESVSETLSEAVAASVAGGDSVAAPAPPASGIGAWVIETDFQVQ